LLRVWWEVARQEELERKHRAAAAAQAKKKAGAGNNAAPNPNRLAAGLDTAGTMLRGGLDSLQKTGESYGRMVGSLFGLGGPRIGQGQQVPAKQKPGKAPTKTAAGQGRQPAPQTRPTGRPVQAPSSGKQPGAKPGVRVEMMGPPKPRTAGTGIQVMGPPRPPAKPDKAGPSKPPRLDPRMWGDPAARQKLLAKASAELGASGRSSSNVRIEPQAPQNAGSPAAPPVPKNPDLRGDAALVKRWKVSASGGKGQSTTRTVT
jgi:hypothetical protein